jgi:hypothetical protein
MQQLRLTGVSQDGRYLLLSDSTGTAYRLPRDERVAAAVRRDTARLGQLEIELDSQLRPREMQARIRAGQTAEEVALAAGVPVDKVRKYEWPVLAEREHLATQARATPVRRPGADERPPALEVAVTTALAAHGASTDALTWDAWRRDDGRWTIRLGFHVGTKDHLATWVFEPGGRVLQAEDDEARWLSGLEPLPLEHAIPGDARPRRLAAVPSPLREPEAALPVEPAAPTREPVTPAAGAGSTDHADEPEPEEPVRQVARAGRRAAVPSWDEIVFGSRRRD